MYLLFLIILTAVILLGGLIAFSVITFKSYIELPPGYLNLRSKLDLMLNLFSIALFACFFYPSMYFQICTASISTWVEPHINQLWNHFESIASPGHYTLIMVCYLLVPASLYLLKTARPLQIGMLKLCMRLNLVNLAALLLILIPPLRDLPAKVAAKEIQQLIGSLGSYEISLFQPSLGINSLFIMTLYFSSILLSLFACLIIAYPTSPRMLFKHVGIRFTDH